MENNLLGFGLPFLYLPKSREEKIEEAYRSGYIKSYNPDDINSNRERLCCKACGSLNVIPGEPIYVDNDKGVEIPYLCLDCDYIGSRAARIKSFDDAPDGGICLMVDLVPDGLVGVTGMMLGEG